jgi:peptidoglycan/LPS O-acetylase OafA/YrhL
MKYRPDIDGLRALAVVSVMVYHLAPRWLPGGFIGVDVFFVISGFVVCASLAASERTRLPGFVAEFYARRLARIIPALVAMLAVASVVSTLFVPKAWVTRLNDQTVQYAYFGLSNVLLMTDTNRDVAPSRAELNPYAHTWSLGVEEQFYLLFPLACFFWVRATSSGHHRGRLAMVALLGSAAGLSFAGSRWATEGHPIAAFYSSAFRFWELAAGALLFQLTATRPAAGADNNPAWRRPWPWVGLLTAAAGLFLADPRHFPYPWALAAVAGTLLMIGGANAPDHIVRRAFSDAGAVWIGKRSYSLYLWHWPVFVFLRWTVGLDGVASQVAAVGSSVILAIASYRVIEVPARYSRALSRSRPLVRITCFLFVVLLGWKFTDGVLSRPWGLSVVSRNSADWYPEAGEQTIAGAERRCTVRTDRASLADGSVATLRPINCGQQGPGDERTLYVLGDSHAQAYGPLLNEVSATAAIDVKIYTMPGCPYLNLLEPMTTQPRCLAFWPAASDNVLAAAKTGDVLFLPTLRQRRFVDQWTEDEARAGQSLPYEAGEDATARATREATEWLRPFAVRGMDVIFEAPKPLFKSPAFRCADWFNQANPVCQGGLTQPRAYLLERRRPIIEAMHEVIAEVPHVRIWDPFPALCPEQTCSALDGRRPLFFDGDHLSAYGNLRVYSSFVGSLASGAMEPREVLGHAVQAQAAR